MVPSFKNTALIFPEISFIQFLPLFSCSSTSSLTYFHNRKTLISLKRKKILCSSRKYPCPPQGRLTEFPRGRGVSKALFFEGKYDTKNGISEGVGGFKL